MKKSPSVSFPRISVPLLALVVTVVTACGRQSEGDRCGVNTDCTDGLVCTKSALLQGATQNRCCPSDLSRASTTACKGVAIIQPEIDDTNADSSAISNDAGADSSNASADAGAGSDSASSDASGGQ